MEKQADETTPMVPIGDPGLKVFLNHPRMCFVIFPLLSGPSYVMPGQQPRLRERHAKQFQCCLCTGLL